jgi:molybdate transport system substrate-binding protein
MKKLLLAAILLGCTAWANAQEITIAAAADLQAVFPEIISRFEHETGKKVRVNFGSSGQFLQQIENGAPFDLFFSADVQYPQKLESEGLAEHGSLYRYAVGRLVLFVPSGSKLDPSRGMRVLLQPEVNKIAIANPQHAPYGRAAVEALRKEGIYDAVQPKLVMGENISQAAQFVHTGSADAGLIALSLARSPQMKSAGRYIDVPAADYTAIEQAAVILKSSKEKPGAAQFLDFLRRPEIVKLMTEYGFTTPSAK